MLILLPPSEGKSTPRRGQPLMLESLGFDELTRARRAVLDALVRLCSSGGDPERRMPEPLVDRAAAVLRLGSTQHSDVHSNGRLAFMPTARADKVYTGVLYDALDIASLDGPARRRATRWVAITSSLFGLVRPDDRIPAYRLSGDVTLPGLGGVAAHWRQHLGPAVGRAAGNGLVVDLRSTMYAAFWRPDPETARRVATVRVLHQVGTERKVVSHFNKATKGRLVRQLLQDGASPRTPAALAEHLRALGWDVEVGPFARTGHQLDVIVGEL